MLSASRHGCVNFLPILEFRNTIRLLNVITTQISLRCYTYIATSHWNHDYSINKSVENYSFIKLSQQKLPSQRPKDDELQRTTTCLYGTTHYSFRRLSFYISHAWTFDSLTIHVDMCIIFRAFYCKMRRFRGGLFKDGTPFMLRVQLDRRWGQMS